MQIFIVTASAEQQITLLHLPSKEDYFSWEIHFFKLFIYQMGQRSDQKICKYNPQLSCTAKKKLIA